MITAEIPRSRQSLRGSGVRFLYSPPHFVYALDRKPRSSVLQMSSYQLCFCSGSLLGNIHCWGLVSLSISNFYSCGTSHVAVVPLRKVERHIKRLTAPLLLRAGERVRNYKEAPETLRLGVRRASKGYGHRITRQCAISSGFAAAWGAVGEDVAAAAAANAGGLPASWKAVGAAEAIATETPVGVGVRQSIPMQTTGPEAETKSTDSGQTSVDCGRMPIGCSTQTQSQKSVDGKREASPGHGDGSTEKMHATSTPSQIAISAQQSDRANEALSEVVRLAMVMFDKIIPAGEHMDITLLSVGLAGFRNLCGSAQTGIARYDR